jgi:hypothetical protein
VFAQSEAALLALIGDNASISAHVNHRNRKREINRFNLSVNYRESARRYSSMSKSTHQCNEARGASHRNSR